MTTALLVDLALVVLLLGAAVWAQRLVADLRTLPRADAATGATPSSVSVVVPARDEEQTLPALLRSVAEQLPEVREVEGKGDGAGEPAARSGALVLQQATVAILIAERSSPL